jgi:glycosyltransferase involved in cell wall biosynthesis
MPVHNGAEWIGASLESIAQQADDGIEVLVIDSSPDDAATQIARGFADRLRLRIFSDSPLIAWQAKTNEAVLLAGAGHVCWLHQDDLWLPDRAAEMRRWIAEDPDAALHVAASLIVDRAARKLGVWRCPFRGEGPVPTQLFLERLLVQNFISAPAPLFRKDAWLASGGMDEELWYTGDWDVWLKLAKQGRVRHHQTPTTAFRVHGSSLTVTGSRDTEDFERQMIIVLERHLPLLAKHRKSVRRASLASIRVNCALAAASGGKWVGLLGAGARVLALGPSGIRRYMRDSRIVDRLMPRLRAKLTGSF